MPQEQWTIKRALDWTRGFLAEKGCDNAKASAEWLIGACTGLSRLELYMDLDRPLSADELSQLHDHVKRRAMGEPLQYISGKAAFRHITLNVRKGVLIPRPETEVLVSELLACLPEPKRPCAIDSEISEYGELLSGDARAAGILEGCSTIDEDGLESAISPQNTENERIKVADLCTGSGCIACSLAYEHPGIDAIATDISPDAVHLARDNAKALGLEDRVQVVECDLGQGIDARYIGAFDAVVSNPPYVPSAVLAELPEEVVGFEPHLALDGGPDGLDLFRRITEWSRSALKPGGILAVELHETCLDEAAGFAASSGFGDIRIAYDLASRPRVLIARSHPISS